jgi:hypothetical protein
MMNLLYINHPEFEQLLHSTQTVFIGLSELLVINITAVVLQYLEH